VLSSLIINRWVLGMARSFLHKLFPEITYELICVKHKAPVFSSRFAQKDYMMSLSLLSLFRFQYVQIHAVAGILFEYASALIK